MIAHWVISSAICTANTVDTEDTVDTVDTVDTEDTEDIEDIEDTEDTEDICTITYLYCTADIANICTALQTLWISRTSVM